MQLLNRYLLIWSSNYNSCEHLEPISRWVTNFASMKAQFCCKSNGRQFTSSCYDSRETNLFFPLLLYYGRHPLVPWRQLVMWCVHQLSGCSQWLLYYPSLWWTEDFLHRSRGRMGSKAAMVIFLTYGKVAWVTALIFTGDVEDKLQRLQWASRLSPWRTFHFYTMPSCFYKIHIFHSTPDALLIAHP